MLSHQQYGFTKVRRGPDTDMYAHPSFARKHPELLSQLRKCTSAARRRLLKVSSEDSDSGNDSPQLRSVSPSPPRAKAPTVAITYQPIAEKLSDYRMQRGPPPLLSQSWLTFQQHGLTSSYPRQERGKLDLLALAIEREGCFAA